MKPLVDNRLPSKQVGATLFTALVFLLLMTIVTVSASRISIQDTYIANNAQQKQLMFQQTANDLVNLTTVIKLYAPITGSNGAAFAEGTGIYELPEDANKAGTAEKITKLNFSYPCGGFDGLAVSLGPDTNHCDLFDFSVDSRAQGFSGAKDRQNRGAGKELPTPGKHSYLGQ